MAKKSGAKVTGTKMTAKTKPTFSKGKPVPKSRQID